jgi:hypothetical protein
MIDIKVTAERQILRGRGQVADLGKVKLKFNLVIACKVNFSQKLTLL